MSRILITLVVLVGAYGWWWRARSRRRRLQQTETVSPRWRVEHAYDKEGDRR